MLIRNLLVLPLILTVRMFPMVILVMLEKIVEFGYIYQNFLNKNGVYWKTGVKK